MDCSHMPQATDAHKKLHALAGNWSGDEKMHPSPWDPKGGIAQATIQSRVDLDGFVVISDYLQKRDGNITYRGHGVFGYEVNEKCYTMHWFDSMSGACCAPPARGEWNGNILTFENKSPMGHGRYTFGFPAAGKYTFKIEQSMDGKQWMPFIEATYSRG
ncbi:MAG: DUF1579 family protein [Planctomycetes bacterium]|nr:DUF1579 family protein [Planctomycetota bacterium]